MPPAWRSCGKAAARPVTSLCTYAWWPVSQTIASVGLSNTLWSAKVSSTTPRFGERWPPVREVCSTRNARTSPASWFSWVWLRALRSAGEWIASSMATSLVLTRCSRQRFRRARRPRVGRLASHELSQLDAQPRPRAAGPAEHSGQLEVGVPRGGGDVDVCPRLAAGELGDEHTAQDRPRFAVLGVAQVGDLAAEEDAVVGVDRQPPHSVAGFARRPVDELPE